MNKLSKRAISILVIATFLISMIPIMPAQAVVDLSINVSGIESRTADPWADGASATEAVVVTTDQAHSGTDSLSMTTGTTINTEYSRIIIDVPDVLLQDFVEPTIWVYADATETGGSYDPATNLPEVGGDTFFPYGLPYINIQIDSGGGSVMDEKLEALGSMPNGNPDTTIATNTWTQVQEAWGYYDSNDDLGSGYDRNGIWTVGSLDEWKTYMLANYPLATVTGIEITYGMWGVASLGPIYVDDVQIGEVLSYTFETAWNDKGDTLVVSGEGVTSGSVVNVYWDYVNAAGLMNNTVGNPDGTYSVELDVPSCLPGNHYVWIKDVDTGETLMEPIPIMVLPLVKLSPKSGLEDDEVTVTGYGYAANSELSLTFGAFALSVTPTTDDDGYFTITFDVPTDVYNPYAVVATGEKGWAASADFTVGASLTLDIEEGPEGALIEVSGEGFPDGPLGAVNWDGVPMTIVSDPVTISGGAFTVEVIVPSTTGEGDHILMIVDTVHIVNVEAEFKVDGVASITVSPTYGAPGATITVTGANFTQIAGTEVTLDLWFEDASAASLGTVDTNAAGTFETTFTSPAVSFENYDVRANDVEYSLVAMDAFKVGMIALIINPTSGASGTEVGLTGVGFTEGDFNMTFGEELFEYPGGVVSPEIIAKTFYVPNVDPGTYLVTVIDEDENELTATFVVTESTIASIDPVVAPTGYNVTLSGNNFADAIGDIDVVVYNSTYDLPITVQTTTADGVLPDPDVDPTATDDEGNFTGWWEVDADLSNGDYIINITGGQGILVQLDFSVVAARVSVTPRKTLFARGDTVSFDISNDFDIDGSTIEIYSPDETLYWITDLLDDWVLVNDLYTVPYYSQLANSNPMELASDAPLGTWTYFFYDGGDELMNSTFVVGASTAAQVDALLEDVRDDISSLASDLAGITDDLEDDVAALSDEIGGVSSDMDALRDNIVGDLADDIAQATDAGQAALDAVEDLAGSMTDLGDAMSDMADLTSETAESAQAAADAANEAIQATQDTQDKTSGLTTLVYGAIGASLIAALAAIVSLMQISKKIAG